MIKKILSLVAFPVSIKLLLLTSLLNFCICVYSQKKYVTVRATMAYSLDAPVMLSGDIPASMKNRYDNDDFVLSDDGFGTNYCVGNVLNLLSKHGFIVEQMSTAAATSPADILHMTFLLSKSEIISSNKLEENLHNKATSIVARYNLQGVPVNENEKGVQIIVYSNYTIKTIVKE